MLFGWIIHLDSGDTPMSKPTREMHPHTEEISREVEELVEAVRHIA